MKHRNNERASVELMQKLEKWALSDLSKEELAVLNAILGVYHLGMENKSVILKDHPEFLKEVAAAPSLAIGKVATFLTPITPYTTTTTITTTVASHPIITCPDKS